MSRRALGTFLVAVFLMGFAAGGLWPVGNCASGERGALGRKIAALPSEEASKRVEEEITMLGSATASARIEAIYRICRDKSDGPIARLVEVGLDDPSRDVWEYACISLANWDHPAVAIACAQRLPSANPELRSRMAVMLLSKSDRLSFVMLKGLALDEDYQVAEGGFSSLKTCDYDLSDLTTFLMEQLLFGREERAILASRALTWGHCRPIAKRSLPQLQKALKTEKSASRLQAINGAIQGLLEDI